MTTTTKHLLNAQLATLRTLEAAQDADIQRATAEVETKVRERGETATAISGIEQILAAMPDAAEQAS